MESQGSRPRFTCDFARTAGATVIALAGEFDVICVDAFRRRLAEATEDDPERIVLDLRELTFIDSTALALLLRVNEMSQDGGFDLSIVSLAEDPPSRIFRLTGTDKILPLVDAVPELEV